MYFRQFFLQMLIEQSYKSLYIGKNFLKTFQEDYKDMRPYIRELHIPLKSKLLYWIAFVISPKISHLIILGKLKIRKVLK